MLTTLLTRPMFTLVIEIVLASLLALVIGYVLNRKGGLGAGLWTGAATVIANLILLIPVLLLASYFLPFNQLALNAGQFSPDAASHLANTYLVFEVAIWTTMLSAVVGYTFNTDEGMLILTGAATVAAFFCILAAALPFYPFGFRDTSWLLAIAVALIGVAGARIFSNMFLSKKGFLVLVVLWAEYVLACWIGYVVAGRIGFLLITLPSQLVLMALLYFVSGLILPSQDPAQRNKIFRSLLTFNLGTQYPYYVIEDWRNRSTLGQKKPEPRVPGDPFGEEFAGPGIILNRCDQAVVTSTGPKFTIHPPGLSFTEKFQTLYTDVDLRPQLRVLTVEAETKDGIKVKVLAFAPHRINTGGRTPQLGESYPYDEEAMVKAVYQNAVVQHEWNSTPDGIAEGVKTVPWYELVLLKAPPILKDIIANYTCDQLHQPGDPRVEIAGQFSARMKEVMAPFGIEMVGGGISNIIVPDNVNDQRIKSWEAKWEGKIDVAVGKAEAEVEQQLRHIEGEVRAELLQELAEILLKEKSEQVQEGLLIQQLIEALGVKAFDKSESVTRVLEQAELLRRQSTSADSGVMLDLLGMTRAAQ